MKKHLSLRKTVAIIGGTGRMGKVLACRLAQAGYEIFIGTRSIAKAQIITNQWLSQIDGFPKFHVVSYQDAASLSDIVILTVPYGVHREILRNIRCALRGKLLIDVTVPLSPTNKNENQIPQAGSAAQEALLILGNHTDICTAFQNISHTKLSKNTDQDCDVLVTGTSELARTETLKIVADLGLRGWDAGPIENSAAVEGMTSILLHINKKYHSSHAGIKITGG